jgi:hypothetical protein
MNQTLGTPTANQHVTGPATRGKWQHRKTPLASIHPTIRDLAWAAGFIEGEGTFINNGWTERVEASQKTIEPLLRLQELFGGSVNTRKDKMAMSFWCVCGARARGVIYTLYSFLSARRREQAKRALKLA